MCSVYLLKKYFQLKSFDIHYIGNGKSSVLPALQTKRNENRVEDYGNRGTVLSRINVCFVSPYSRLPLVTQKEGTAQQKRKWGQYLHPINQD